MFEMEPNIESSSQAEQSPLVDDGNWRTQLPPDTRARIINKIMETLKRHLPFSGEEGLQELRRITVRFEDKIYCAATNMTDYLRKISLKMLTMESNSQNSTGPRLETSMQNSYTLNSGQIKQLQLEMIAEKIEENMYSAAMSQPEYLRKIDILKEACNEVKSSDYTA